MTRKAQLVSAQEYTGMRTYALVEKLFKTYGEKNGVLCIGPAGEYQLASASIQSSDVDGHPCRAAGRGGLDVVMGAKGLKAIVVDERGKMADTLADPETLRNGAAIPPTKGALSASSTAPMSLWTRTANMSPHRWSMKRSFPWVA